MKKLILPLVLCLFVTGPSFAQNNVAAMKFLTVNALMQYGRTLYDRGDFNGATAVFDHVLIYDHHQAQALQFLKDMGHVPVAFVPNVPVPNIRVASNPDEQIVDRVDLSSTVSLKNAIEAKKRVIGELRTQIMQMKENLNEY